MASVITYLLVSNPDSKEAVQSHSIVKDHGFEVQETSKEQNESVPALRFVVRTPLEETSDLETPCRKLSAAFPETTVTYCEVEERFEQVEHVRTVVFIGGRHAGEIEHGYILNVGS